MNLSKDAALTKRTTQWHTLNISHFIGYQICYLNFQSAVGDEGFLRMYLLSLELYSGRIEKRMRISDKLNANTISR